MANPRQVERDSNESMHETTRRAAEQASQTSRTVSDAAERTARAGSEAFRRNAETLSSTWRNSSEAATRIAERSVDQFSKLFGLTGDTARETPTEFAGQPLKADPQCELLVAKSRREFCEVPLSKVSLI